MKKSDMNLLESYQSLEKIKKSHTSDGVLYLGIIAVTIILLGAYATKVYLDNSFVKNQITELKAFVESATVQGKLAEAQRIEDNLLRVDEIEVQVDAINKVLDFIPIYDQKILDLLYKDTIHDDDTKPDNVHYSKFTYDQNTLTIEYYEHEAPSQSVFALRLLESGLFSDVSYTGYTYDDAENVFRGKIVCIVKGGY